MTDIYEENTIKLFETAVRAVISEYITSVNDSEFHLDLPETTVKDIQDSVYDYLMSRDSTSDDYLPFYYYDSGKPYLLALIEHLSYDIIRCELGDFEYQLEHENESLVLDQQNKQMLYNGTAVPAYWYNEDMTQKEIDDHLKEYRSLWADAQFEEITYPVLQGMHVLRKLQKDGRITEKLLQKMESDLERMETEEARALYDMLQNNVTIYTLLDNYPDKLTDVSDITFIGKGVDKFRPDGSMYETTLVLKDGEKVPVKLIVDRRSICSMTSLGERGFPMLTKNDEKLILGKLGI